MINDYLIEITYQVYWCRFKSSQITAAFYWKSRSRGFKGISAVRCFASAFHSCWNDSPAHALGRQLSLSHCPTSEQLNSTESNGWELSYLSLMPGCKHLTRACPYRINSAPFKNLPLWLRARWVCGCALLQHKRDRPLLSYRPRHGPGAPIIPLSAHNKSLAACHIQRVNLVIKVTELHEKGSGVVLFEGLIWSLSVSDFRFWPGPLERPVTGWWHQQRWLLRHHRLPGTWEHHREGPGVRHQARRLQVGLFSILHLTF